MSGDVHVVFTWTHLCCGIGRIAEDVLHDCTATVTVTAYSPTDTADALEFSYRSAGSVYPIQVRSQLKAADAARYEVDLRTIYEGVRVAS
ncbi:hypothetical protein [Nocardia sp. NPDC058497]|uniref:hypothetical protein n=1 Tax=Nocardia sp. NPDC058497 TaxID=3346529 RepID=UPI00365F64CC